MLTSALEFEFLSKYEGLVRGGMDTGSICEEGLAKILGIGGASAAMFYIGNDRANPRALLAKLKLLFKAGTEVLLLQLIDQGSSHRRSA